MLRLLLLVLLHFVKRLSAGLTLFRGDRVEQGYSRNFQAEEEQGRWSALTILVVCCLVFYILGGLGLYAKTQIWDALTSEQKDFIIRSMLIDQQML